VPRPARILLAAAAAALATAALAGLHHRTGPRAVPEPTGRPVPPTGNRSSSGDQPQPGSTGLPPMRPGPPSRNPAADPLDGPISDTALQRLIDAHTDIPATLRRQLAGVASQLLTADLTGNGHARLARAYPDYWPAGAASRPTVAGLHIHAVALHSHTGPDVVEATVIWSARQSTTGQPLQQRYTSIIFAYTDDRWTPRPPWF
jgi:hypothetical protein